MRLVFAKPVTEFNNKYFADTMEEALRIAPMGSEAGNFFMMVVSYWTRPALS